MMNLTPKNVASYWLNSLKLASAAEWKIDPEDMKKKLAEAQEKACKKNPPEEIMLGEFHTPYSNTESLKDLSKQNCLTEFVLHPLVYSFKPHNSNKHFYYFPLMIYVKYSEEAIEYTSMAFPRALLEPLGEQSDSLGEQPILMTVEEAEEFITEIEDSLQNRNGIEKINAIALKVKERIHGKMCGYVPSKGMRQEYGFHAGIHYFKKFQDSNPLYGNIYSVYETIRSKADTSSADELKLFKTVATFEHKERPLYDSAQHRDSFYHRLGHGSCDFPLAPAQRNALSSFMQSATGTVQAVNGPPGTGKTTLLLSVVASLLVEHALKGEHPPCIAASSSNNKAVSNIIDAFGKDFSSGTVNTFAGRWLPKTTDDDSESTKEYTDWSLGFYIVSATYESKNAESLKNYFFTTSRNKKYHLPDDAVDISANKAFFLKKAQQAFPELRNSGATVRDVVKVLENQLKDGEKKLRNFHDAYHEFECALQIFKSTPHLEMIQNITAMGVIAYCRNKLPFFDEYNIAQHTVQQFLAEECFLYPLFDWIPAVRKKRFARLCLKISGFCTANPNLDTIPLIEEALKTVIAAKTRFMDSCGRYIAALDAVLSNPAGKSTVCKADDDWQFSFDEIDAKVDTGMRFSLFRLAVHYWEGRWLMAGESKNNPKEEPKAKEQREFRTQLMLTPCVVSTFFTLPGALSTYKSSWLDFLDLLIIDEAGQATPEVAGAVFALAKRALVVGDTQQIEPIWNTSRQLDIANSLQAGICNNSDEYYAFAGTGRACASGSIMSVAQTTSPDTQTDFCHGMFLDEHRRCYDSIIEYCNALCYQGRLTPLRGKQTDSSDALPCMGYVHVNGVCTAGTNGSSKCNSIEAATIAAWITQYKDALLKMYQQKEINSTEKKYHTISDIVAVVTPFNAQKLEINRWLNNQTAKGAAPTDAPQTGFENSNSENITVGTVHALQGAERPVVIFSPTYTQQTPGSFIGRSNSMLNVAVSRAKDSFLVFGDMDFLKSDTSCPQASGSASGSNFSPCQLLAQELFKAPNSDLSLPGSFTAQDMKVDFAKDDITKKLIETEFQGSTVSWLTNAKEHDAFLLEALQTAKSRVVIFSPWFMQNRLTELGFDKKIKETTARNVVVTIYADKKLTTDKASGRQTCETLREFVKSLGAELIFLDKIHNKDCSVDEEVLCTGSFNWFSACREGDYCREETSTVCKYGKMVQERINILLQRLTKP